MNYKIVRVMTVKEVIFDGKLMRSIKGTHTMFRESLSFSDRYRNNMDSLFDELLNIKEEVFVSFVNYEDMHKNLGEYAEIYRSVFEDVSNLNKNLKVTFDS